jgi:hypothetical protein
MLGPAKLRRLDAPIAVSLEDLVPQDNFDRHLEKKLDLSFVREWTRHLCRFRPCHHRWWRLHRHHHDQRSRLATPPRCEELDAPPARFVGHL